MNSLPFIDLNPDLCLLQRESEVFLAPERWKHDVSSLLKGKKAQALKVAEMKGNLPLPAHGTAMGAQVSRKLVNTELTYEHALKFLRKDTLPVGLFPAMGWQTVSYKNVRLGLVKVLEGRVNNYYPAEFRLRQSISL